MLLLEEGKIGIGPMGYMLVLYYLSSTHLFFKKYEENRTWKNNGQPTLRALLGFESQLEMPTLSHFHIQMQNGKALASSKAWGWLWPSAGSPSLRLSEWSTDSPGWP